MEQLVSAESVAYFNAIMLFKNEFKDCQQCYSFSSSISFITSRECGLLQRSG